MIRQIKWLKWLYLVLAILGAVLPTLANIEFAKSYGPAFDIQLFIELANNNPASQSLSIAINFPVSPISLRIFSNDLPSQMCNRHIYRHLKY